MSACFTPKIRQVECVDSSGYTDFVHVFKTQLYQKRVPLVIKSLNIGSCVENWSWKYLKEKWPDKVVKLHVSTSEQLNFIAKNFSYQSMPFSEFIDNLEKQDSGDCSRIEKYYLRSLGNDPRKDVCDIYKHFPELSDDINFPDMFEKEQIYSSVFRIASKGVQLWTHYDVGEVGVRCLFVTQNRKIQSKIEIAYISHTPDSYDRVYSVSAPVSRDGHNQSIMDNILVQVKGRKRITLFSPEDVDHLYLNGDKSEVIDIENADLKRHPLFAEVVHHQCHLDGGDVLFIPALWFHNVINETSTISVNIFWRHLPAEFYDSSDVYGNKDLLIANSAESIVDRVIKKINTLPPIYKEFYTRRFVNKIKDKCL
ncbi:hypothetical protein HELRODRAFT_194025 [Helobdella robusta]|uniref:JmjC domain-containing protein n=1 Tax=Helobdella robusta TaxID=6412 RepID=T1FVL0_HELRO|nr:hypothetical protein HELRODRAFT_194025 [Helobdella robusta]ESN93691.1 hypothetical protein HELRODRAFT_194025 [Helobdella robusta]